uniref:Uncharacterized protein n=1 Tax=Cucumis melo TaxID=3656 RepID=A0A9I9ED85_CUCME
MDLSYWFKIDIVVPYVNRLNIISHERGRPPAVSTKTRPSIILTTSLYSLLVVTCTRQNSPVISSIFTTSSQSVSGAQTIMTITT